MIVLKFENDSLPGGAVEFHDDEVRGLVYSEPRNEKIYHLMTGYHKITTIGTLGKEIVVNFRPLEGDYGTISKIESLFDLKDNLLQPTPMTVRYEYSIDPESAFLCQMKRDDYVQKFARGYKSTDEIRIKFVGTISGVPAVAQKTVGV